MPTSKDKLYVIQHRRTKLYIGRRKRSGETYWKLYIGKPPTGAIRYRGSKAFDDLLAENEEVEAIEVKA